MFTLWIHHWLFSDNHNFWLLLWVSFLLIILDAIMDIISDYNSIILFDTVDGRNRLDDLDGWNPWMVAPPINWCKTSFIHSIYPSICLQAVLSMRKPQPRWLVFRCSWPEPGLARRGLELEVPIKKKENCGTIFVKSWENNGIILKIIYKIL